MLGLFIILPLITLLANVKSIFLWSYLGFIELLIVMACIKKANEYKLNYKIVDSKLSVKSGLFSKNILVLCERVALVHTEGKKQKVQIVVITESKKKSRNLKPVTKGFLSRYNELSEDYYRLKRVNPEGHYYFRIIGYGDLKKYELLDLIYKNCVKATYTSSAIKSIKLARGYEEI